MRSTFFLSLIPFCLAAHFSTYAEEIVLEDELAPREIEEEIVENQIESDSIKPRASETDRKRAFAQAEDPSKVEKKDEPQKPLPPKKMKPHFAGVKRPVAKPKSVEAQKKSNKVKNQWFSSKTQPKNTKKPTPSTQEDSTELPSDRPYFRKINASMSPALMADNTPSLNVSSTAFSQDPFYPKMGFEAPFGHVFITAEWLYWKAHEEGLEFATSKQITFDFESGFRVGFGVHLPSSDGWTVYANYTYFNPEGSKSVNGTLYPLFLFQGAGVSGSAVSSASGHWNIGFQSLDLLFARPYHLSKTLVLRPSFGLKGAWIDQKGHFHYQGGYIPSGQTFETHFKNDAKGAGPLFATEINWQLGSGFSLFGDLAASLLICHFDTKQTQEQLGGVEVVHLENDFNLVNPLLQMVGGLGWDRNFNKDQCHVGLSVAFEALQLWGQNQIEQFTDDVRPIYVRESGSLGFYGLTLRARVDF